MPTFVATLAAMSSRNHRRTQKLRKLLAEEAAKSSVGAREAAPSGRPGGPPGWEAATPLERLSYMREVLLRLESDISHEVDRARDQGVPWVAIGRVFEITGEGARRRWFVSG